MYERRLGYLLIGSTPGVRPTISGYSGLDPEVAIVGLTSGVDPINKYPNLRSYIVGASFNF